MAVVASDTSPIRALEHIGRLDLLEKLFGEVLIPPAVAGELSTPRSALKPLDAATLGLRILSPRDTSLVNRLRADLGAGESEALALAIEVHATAILMDESEGRAFAERLGLKPRGVLGILTAGKMHGYLPAVGPLMDRLRNELKFYISNSTYRSIIELANE